MTDSLSPEVEKEIAVAARAWLARWDIRVREEFLLDLLRAQRLAGRKETNRDADAEIARLALERNELRAEAEESYGRRIALAGEVAALRAQVEALTHTLAEVNGARADAEIEWAQERETLTLERDEALMQRNAACDREDANRVRAEAAETSAAFYKAHWEDEVKRAEAAEAELAQAEVDRDRFAREANAAEAKLEKQARVVEAARDLISFYPDADWFPGLRAALAALDESESEKQA